MKTLIHISFLLFFVSNVFSKQVEASKQQIRKWLKPKFDNPTYIKFRQRIKNMEEMRFIEDPETHKIQLKQLRKLLQVKHLSMWLQTNNSDVNDYCFYGCHCLPEGYHNTSVPGYGRPVDNADKACLIQTRCHHCIRREYGEGNCEPTSTAYEYGLKYDDARIFDTNLRDIECKDSWEDAGCRRATCECDRGLAIRLREAKVSKIVWEKMK